MSFGGAVLTLLCGSAAQAEPTGVVVIDGSAGLFIQPGHEADIPLTASAALGAVVSGRDYLAEPLRFTWFLTPRIGWCAEFDFGNSDPAVGPLDDQVRNHYFQLSFGAGAGVGWFFPTVEVSVLAGRHFVDGHGSSVAVGVRDALVLNGVWRVVRIEVAHEAVAWNGGIHQGAMVALGVDFGPIIALSITGARDLPWNR
ncbi:MAG: hypothetical protein U0271_42650 [Polyangiaceae bacterium]